MSKSSKTSALPPKGVLGVSETGELVIRTADRGDFLLTEIARVGAGDDNAELRLVIELSESPLGISDARADIRSIALKLETFIAQRALNAITAEATCSNVPSIPNAPPARPAHPNQPVKPAKPAKPAKKSANPKSSKP